MLKRLRLGDRRAIYALVRVAEHGPCRETRQIACAALGELDDRRAVDGLLRIAEHDADSRTRASAYRALLRFAKDLQYNDPQSACAALEKLCLGEFGNRRAIDGLSRRALQAADTVVTIPMAGGVDSLNVAAAAAVALWELRPRD